MAQSLTDIKSDAITSVIANTISTINSTVSNVANNVTTLTSTVGNVAANVSNVQSTITTLVTPKISSITYPGDDTAALPAGGQTITLTGTGFNSGASVLINGTYASVVSVVSSTSITFTAPAMAAGTYILYVINTDGGTSISIPGISYSGTPIWSTSAGTLGTSYETSSISSTLTATGDAPITYSLFSGTLPPGSSLNSSSGLLSGTSQGVASSTTYNFTIRATDGQNQDTDRAFSITVNPDVVTWNSPADGTSTALFQNQAMSNVTLSATSAAGKSITYTANALPTGVTITGAVVNGTPTTLGTTNSLITATAATTNKTSTRNFTWVVSVANDTYFNNTTLLLNGETTVTPFISDISTNNFGLTINGDTKPVLFNPYTPGYYSNYFDGTGDYLTFPNNSAFAFGTGAFTIEFWVNFSLQSDKFFLGGRQAIGTMHITTGGVSTSTTPGALRYVGSSTVTSGSTVITDNTWHHCAIVRDGSTNITVYVDGVSRGTGTDTTNYTTTSGDWWFASNDSGGPGNHPTGYISNFRIVKGTAVYTSAFTPSATPLTAIANTSLLTCQSNRFIDNSTNAFTITKVGDTTISPAIPFTANSSYSTYGSAYFDGTGDTLYIPSPTTGFSLSTGEFTIEMWVYKTSAVNSVLLDARSSAAGLPWVFAIDGSNFPYWYDNTVYTSTVAVTLNSWNHVAAVRTSGVLKIFVNGVQGYSASYGINLDRTAGLVIGDTVHAAGPMLGYISNLRIVKGTAVYTTAFTPPTAPLTAIANTQLLTCQYNGGATNQAIIDNSNFNNIITRNGNVSQGTFSPYSVTGWSNYFDGTGDYLSVPDNAAFALGSSNFTMEAWIYPTATGNFPVIASQYQTSSTSFFWSLGPTATPRDANFYLYGSSNISLTASNAVVLNTWAHHAVVRYNNVLTYYINGVSVASVSSSTTVNDSTSLVTIGSGGDTGYTTYPTYPFTGYISNLRIVVGTAVYTAAFTPSTTPLTAIANTSLLTCQSNRFIDNSPNSFTLTRTGDVSVQALDPFSSVPEAVPISYSNYFDGTGDYLYSSASSANAMGTGDYTVEAWIYVTAAFGTTGSGRGAIISNRGQESAGAAFMLQHYNGKIYFGTSSVDVIVGSTTMVTNTWYHVVVSRNSGTVRLFLNGATDATAVVGNSTNHSDTNAFYVGIDGDYDRYPFTGYISNARLVKGTAVYTSAFTPSTTPLTAIANTSLLTCQSTRMIDNSTNAFTITASGDTKPRIFNPFGYTAQTATSYTPSLHGGSIYLDGTGDNLTTPNISSWQFGTGDFTVEFWVYAISSGTMVGLTSSGAGAGYWNAILSSGNVGWASGVVFRLTSGVSYFNGWMHVAYVRKSGTLNIYINGINRSSGADSTNYNATVGTLKIGTGDSYGTMNGYISDLRITKGTSLYTSNFVPPTQTLTNYSTTNPASLLLNFTNGGIIDQHSTNVLETVGNAQLSTAVKKYGSASMRFDGSGDYLTIQPTQNLEFGSGDFTIEFWWYPTATGRQALYHGSVGADYSIGLDFNSVNTQKMGLFVSSNGSSWNLIHADSGGAGIGTTTPTQNAWNHIAVTRSGTTFMLFVNGNRDLNITGISGSIASRATYQKVIGSWWNTSAMGQISGYIDDFRITKGYARYTSNFTAPTSAFIAK